MDNSIKEINKQLRSERGYIQIRYEYPSEDAARIAGYSYMFTSSDLNAFIYGKVLDIEGHIRECVIIYR